MTPNTAAASVSPSRATSGQAFRLAPVDLPGIKSKLWTLTFDLPGEKVNKFSSAVMEEFQALIPQLRSQGERGEIEGLILVSGKTGNFIAGADIELIRSAETAEQARDLSRKGQEILDAWEDLPFPRVVAIQGTALGGGCELSLASSAIVMSDDSGTRIGLPEVMLGIIPGMGGCVRMPRKIGLAGSLDLILTGKTLDGARAYKAGLADACIPKANFAQEAVRWVAKNLDALKNGQRLGKEPKLGGMGGAAGSLLEHTPMGRMFMLKKARESVLSKSRGKYPAPIEALDVIHETGGAYGPKILGTARTRAMEREATGFGRVAATDVSKNLIRIFFLTEMVKKSKGVPGKDIVAKPVFSGAVLGAGVMGGGIAQLMADKGVQARMKDLTNAALATGVQTATKIFGKQVQKRRLTPRQAQQKLNLIAPTVDFNGFNGCEFVIEAIVENMDVKKKVLAELENFVPSQCFIASNTSSLSITEMQRAMKNPGRFGGMHFFNPVAKMPLIEVIRGEQTTDEAVSAIFQYSKQLGKTPIVVKDAPGFLVNRLLMPYLNEATWLLAEGVPIERIDNVMLDFGMPMGPMELIDEVGVDVGDKVANILYKAFGPRFEPAPCNAKIVAAGRLGKKNGKGLYEYAPGGRDKTLNPAVYDLIGVQPKNTQITDQEIIDRCTLPMINEAARCLEDKIVETPGEVDLGMIMGTGFPPFRGGLLRYADSVGTKELAARLKRYQDRFGARFEPSAPLLRRATSDQPFHSR